MVYNAFHAFADQYKGKTAVRQAWLALSDAQKERFARIAAAQREQDDGASASRGRGSGKRKGSPAATTSPKKAPKFASPKSSPKSSPKTSPKKSGASPSCSRVRKAECSERRDCVWTVGKGCSGLASFKATAAATRPNYTALPSAPPSARGPIVYSKLPADKASSARRGALVYTNLPAEKVAPLPQIPERGREQAATLAKRDELLGELRERAGFLNNKIAQAGIIADIERLERMPVSSDAQLNAFDSAFENVYNKIMHELSEPRGGLDRFKTARRDKLVQRFRQRASDLRNEKNKDELAAIFANISQLERMPTSTDEEQYKFENKAEAISTQLFRLQWRDAEEKRALGRQIENKRRALLNALTRGFIAQKYKTDFTAEIARELPSATSSEELNRIANVLYQKLKREHENGQIRLYGNTMNKWPENLDSWSD
jgi:hypothetical protein